MSEEGIHTENKNIRFGIIVNDIGIDSEEVLVNEINSIVCSTGNNLPVFQTNRLEHNCW